MDQKPYVKTYIPIEKCTKGDVYRVCSRNLSIAVYDGGMPCRGTIANGFVGIREKFRNLFLFTEYHWDDGPPFGTVCPLEKIDVLPADIDICEIYPPVDQLSGRLIDFERPVIEGGRGWFYIDTGESDQNIHAVSPENTKLFTYLSELSKKVMANENET